MNLYNKILNLLHIKLKQLIDKKSKLKQFIEKKDSTKINLNH